MSVEDPICRPERIHQVTLEMAESSHCRVPTFQARARLDGMVIQNIGRPQASELKAFSAVTAALHQEVSRRKKA